MKHYLLSIQQPDGGIPAPEILAPIMRDIEIFNKELKAAGAWVFAGGLQLPNFATVVRFKDKELITANGPYMKGNEHLGGLSIIKANDMTSAIDWGRKLSIVTTLPVEVREFQGEIEDHLL
jgi:hypothetical protein